MTTQLSITVYGQIREKLQLLFKFLMFAFLIVGDKDDAATFYVAFIFDLHNVLHFFVSEI